MVDILLSTYNGEKYLRAQLDSLLNQTYKNIHIIVRDDNSKDNTTNILNEYKNAYPEIFELHLETNNIGCKESFFELTKYSKNEYIMFCDQDDVWLNDKVEISLKYIKEKENDKPALVYTDVFVVDENLNTIRNSSYSKRKNPYHTSINKLLFSSKALGMTIIINKKLLSLCRFPKDQRIECHDIWIEYIATGCCTKYYLDRQTVLYRQHSSNTSGGITFYNPLSTFIYGLKNAKRLMKNKRDIASAFLEEYGDSLDLTEKNIVVNFIDLQKFNLLKRISIIKKYDYSTGVLVHFLAMLFF